MLYFKREYNTSLIIEIIFKLLIFFLLVLKYLHFSKFSKRNDDLEHDLFSSIYRQNDHPKNEDSERVS